MKKRKVRLIGIILGILFCEIAFANQLKIVSTTYPPYNYELRGEAAGYASQIINGFVSEFNKSSGSETTIEFLPWTRTLHTAKNTPNTLVYSIARTPEREKQFHWIGRLLPMPVYLYKHKSRKDLVLTERHDSKLWHVGGVMSGAPTLCVEKQGYQIIHKTADLSVQLKMLARGRLDLLVFDSASIKSSLAALNFSYEDFEPVLFLPECSFDLYLALNIHSDAGLLKRVQRAWQVITRKGIVNRVRSEFEAEFQPFL